MEFLHRLRDRFRRTSLRAELDEEMRLHLDMIAREEREGGLSPGEAARVARLRFGNPSHIVETTRSRWGFGWMEELLADLRYGARGLARTPVFTIAITLTLALGIGATSVMYVLMQRTVLASLPVREPQQLVFMVTDRGTDGTNSNQSYAVFTALRNEVKSVDNVMAYSPVDVALRQGDGSVRAHVAAVSSGFFRSIGATLALGREFLVEEERLHGPAVTVLSHSLWQRMGAPTDILGRDISVNGVPFTIVGVASPSFTGATAGAREDLWLPLGALARVSQVGNAMERPTSSWLYVFGRLRRGVTIEGAQTELASFDAGARRRQLRAEGEQTRLLDGSRGLTMRTSSMETPLRLLLLGTSFLLLIGCANIASLLLARADSRHGEMGVRLALGATRARILRQLLTESLLIAAIGGIGGVLVVTGGLQLFAQYIAWQDGRLVIDSSLDPAAVAITIGIAFGTSIIFGLAPALRAAKASLASSIRIRRSDRQRLFGMRGALVVLQLALSLTLVAGAALFVRSLQNLDAVDLGFADKEALLASVDLEQGAYTAATGGPVIARIIEGLKGIPGVRNAAAASVVHPVPYGSHWDGARLESVTLPADASVEFDVNRVSPEYFETLGTPLLSGRVFGAGDVRGAPRVAIVNETFVARYLQGRNPVGLHIYIGQASNEVAFEIVGVAGNGKYRGLRTDPETIVYMPILQQYFPDVTFVIESSSADLVALATQVRSVVANVNPALPVFNVKSLARHIASATAQERLVAILSSVFSVLALALAAIGLFGVIAYAVTQQTRDIGIRMALGATAMSVVRQMVARGIALVVAGSVLGIAGVWYFGRASQALLFGVDAMDLRSLMMAIALLGVTGILAAWLPARRAARVDPLVALRAE